MTEVSVFLSYAREDQIPAKRLFDDLSQCGVKVWMDKESLKPGENWRTGIRNAIRSSDYFLALMSSNSTSKRGFVQNEIRLAVDVLNSVPDTQIYLVPVRLDDCYPEIERLQDLNWTDLFPSWRDGFDRLMSVFAPEVVARRTETNVAARPNGCYRSEAIGKTEARYYYYLRFYPDGNVISASVSDDPVGGWFSKGSSSVASGQWTVNNGKLSFSTTSEQGTVEYFGRVDDNRIILNIHSLINGNRDVKIFDPRNLD